ncbi:hypothetical protein ACGC1H_001223 [Rhizoctonia solani]
MRRLSPRVPFRFRFSIEVPGYGLRQSKSRKAISSFCPCKDTRSVGNLDGRCALRYMTTWSSCLRFVGRLLVEDTKTVATCMPSFLLLGLNCCIDIWINVSPHKVRYVSLSEFGHLFLRTWRFVKQNRGLFGMNAQAHTIQAHKAHH